MIWAVPRGDRSAGSEAHTAQEHRGDVRLLNSRGSGQELGAFTCPGRYREEATADVNLTLEVCRGTVRSVILRVFVFPTKPAAGQAG